MHISVIICTRNRAEQLRVVLDSVAGMVVPKGLAWELLIVDNGGTDHTAEVVDSFSGQLPIRTVVEPQAGLSNARNRGVAEARGVYICWTDDDVRIDPDWLAAYARAFEEHPEAAFFGGPIELLLEGPTPQWLHDNRAALGSLLAERQLGDKPFRFDPDAFLMPYGANYAVRAREQRQQLYDPHLGVSPVQRRLGEETMVLAAIHRDGGVGWWVPDAKVKHVIPSARQTTQYFRQYQRSAGETAAYLADRDNTYGVRPSVRRKSLTIAGAPAHLWGLMAAHHSLYALWRILGRQRRWIRHWLGSAYHSGAIEYWRSGRQQRRQG